MLAGRTGFNRADVPVVLVDRVVSNRRAPAPLHPRAYQQLIAAALVRGSQRLLMR